MLSSVGRPYSQALHSLHCLVIAEFLFDGGEQGGVCAAVEEEEEAFPDDGESGVDCHEREEIGTEGIG